ncbi:DUF2911 domain-containing protein [Horticoccus sp. 23ND18S-11]|uniref:DUF2911 domain-containing protein n=1 Tax=Horticoccus sp. 23ND18S-11 TaxID=3391832 RepID=UPI0039C92D26
MKLFTSRSPLFLAALLSIGSTCVTTAAEAPKLTFPDASPAITMKQRVGVTDIEVSYARPSMKGRKIFGGLVPLGQIWRTGANTATKVTFSTPVKLNGVAVPAGTYELFTIPNAAEWTIILHKNMSQWGSYAYDAKNDVARATAKPVALPTAVESLAIGFNDLRDTSATMYIAWEKTRVPLTLEVDTVGLLRPQIEAAMKADGKKPYFPAAMFYFENNVDLKQALAWMNAGLAEQPEAFWMVYRKGLLLAKMGDKAGAIAAAKQSIELASKKSGELKDEYVRLNEALIASVR